jgi:hypothetical protein
MTISWMPSSQSSSSAPLPITLIVAACAERGRVNVHKRYLLHVAGHNLSSLMRQLIGAGTPREAVAGRYGWFFGLITPAGAVLAAQIVFIVANEGDTLACGEPDLAGAVPGVRVLS